MTVFVEQLAAFVSASEQGSLSEAARILNQTQSEVKTHIANLEARLGVTLFKRMRRNMSPTEIGTHLLPEAKVILGPRERLAVVSGFDEPVEKRLVVAIDELYPKRAARDLQAEFARHFPYIALELLVPIMTDVSRLVLDGKADLGVIWRQEVPSPDLDFKTIGWIPLTLVCGKEQSLAQARIDWKELKLHRLRVAAETWWVESHWVIQQILRQDTGWALIPAHIMTTPPVAEESPPGERNRNDGTGPVALDVIWRKQQPTGPGADWLRHRLAILKPEASQPEARARAGG